MMGDISLEVLNRALPDEYKITPDENEPICVKDVEDKLLIWWEKYGKRHRDNDKPAHISFYRSGKIEMVMWYKDGIICRDNDKPSIVSFYANGKIRSLVWQYDWMCHREGDKPALLGFYGNGVLERAVWYKNGDIYYRGDDKPSKIDCNGRGFIVSLKWYKDSKLHREKDKPAVIEFCSGKLFAEMWYKNGMRHREKKPAIILYDSDGTIQGKGWYLYGVRVTEEFCNQDFDKVDPKVILREKNIQLRMVYIQMIGLEKVLSRLKGKVLDKSRDGQYELLEFRNIFSVPMKVLKMKCPSTGVYYFVPVHPECSTVKNALRFYYGGEEYDFVWEK